MTAQDAELVSQALRRLKQSVGVASPSPWYRHGTDPRSIHSEQGEPIATCVYVHDAAHILMMAGLTEWAIKYLTGNHRQALEYPNCDEPGAAEAATELAANIMGVTL